MKALRNGWLGRPDVKRVKQLLFNKSLQFVVVYGEKVEEEYHYFPSIESAIYSHEFCKAIWGEKSNYSNCGLLVDDWEDDENHCWCNVHEETNYPIVIWQYHLQQMVLTKNRYKYLVDNYEN